MDGSRAAKLALSAAKEKATSGRVGIAGGISGQGPHGFYQRTHLEMEFAQIGDDWFELYAHSLGTNSQWSVTIPYGVVNQAWVDGSGTVMLLLSVRVVLRDTELLIEAYT